MTACNGCCWQPCIGHGVACHSHMCRSVCPLDTVDFDQCESSCTKLSSMGLQVRYVSRKRLAESRPRVRGQFVKAEVAAACRALAAVQVPLSQTHLHVFGYECLTCSCTGVRDFCLAV